MKKIIPYLAFLCLTGFNATNSLPIMAGGCSSQMDKKAEIKCAEGDAECQNEKAENFELNKSVRS